MLIAVLAVASALAFDPQWTEQQKAAAEMAYYMGACSQYVSKEVAERERRDLEHPILLKLFDKGKEEAPALRYTPSVCADLLKDARARL